MTDGVAQTLQGLLDPLLDPASRTWWLALLSAGAVTALLHRRRTGVWRGAVASALPWRLWTHRSSRLDLQIVLVRQCLRLLGLLPGLASAGWLAGQVARGLTCLAEPGLLGGLPGAAWLYTVTLFLAWDLSRYLLHRAMHEVPALWALHQVHHSAEVLTPLTFFRVHPLESLLYEVRGVVVTGLVAGLWTWAMLDEAVQATLLGVHALGLLFNLVSGNLRHSHVWWSFGGLERWLLSPAQHQLHHGLEAPGLNYGTWLALWDRLGGSWAPATRRPRAFGLRQANHALDDVLDVMISPVRAAVRSREVAP